MPKLFPDEFLWGAASSGHQYEGGNYDQWTVWELAHASELASSARERFGWLHSWPKIRQAAARPENYVSGKGIDHYHRYREDFALLKKLGLNSFRFGIEWSRLEPEEGKWNAAEIDHYHNYLSELKKHGITPVVTLWHWTHPVWFDEKGGFRRRSNIVYFERFVQKVMEEYGDELDYVVTINEANNYATLSYALGIWPPATKSPVAALLVYWNLMTAHNRAYRLIKYANPALEVGSAVNMTLNLPKKNDNFFDRLTARAANWFWNDLYLNRTRRATDFVGVNYYFTNYYHHFRVDNPKVPQNDQGWYVSPGDLSELLMRVWLKHHKPIIVTENGISDDTDKLRQAWLKETMNALATARRNGINLRGYMHWSLLDNFEWADGWWPKFGLIGVDRTTLKRTPKASAVWWAKELAAIRSRRDDS
jgi:beta-glucosidase